jgi:hypothetical protein
MGIGLLCIRLIPRIDYGNDRSLICRGECARLLLSIFLTCYLASYHPDLRLNVTMLDSRTPRVDQSTRELRGGLQSLISLPNQSLLANYSHAALSHRLPILDRLDDL